MGIFGTIETLLINSYSDIQPVAQFMNAFLQIFVKEKFIDGDSGKDAAIDAIIAELQTKKSTYVAPK